MDASSLVEKLHGLERTWSSFDWWLDLWTLLVVIGVAIELAVLFTEYAHDWKDFRRGSIRSPERPSLLVFGLGFLGAGLVAGGVAGEFRIHIRAGEIEAEMRDTTRQLVAIANQEAAGAGERAGIAVKEAGNANDRAGKANERASQNAREAALLRKRAEDEAIARAKIEEAVAWRVLTDEQKTEIGKGLEQFHGQIASIACNANAPEGDNFARDIGEALHKAKWVPTEPIAILQLREGPAPLGTNPPLDTGVMISSTGEDNARKASEALVRELSKLGFDAFRSPKDDSVKRNAPVVFVFVEYRPRGPQGSAKLRSIKP